MPARRKTNEATQEALRYLFDRDELPEGAEKTPGYTLHSRLPRRLGTVVTDPFRNPEPQVYVFRRRIRVKGTTRSRNAHLLVCRLWETLPKEERRRSRLFAHCPSCPVRFTKKGAIADAHRCGRLGRYSPPTAKEQASAELRAATRPPELDAQNDHERAIVAVWQGLCPLHQRTIYATLRPTSSIALQQKGVDHRLTSFYDTGPDREWALEGAPSPEAFASRQRSARRALARALASRFQPEIDYSIKTAGRRGFDYARFWNGWRP